MKAEIIALFWLYSALQLNGCIEYSYYNAPQKVNWNDAKIEAKGMSESHLSTLRNNI